MAKVKCPNCNKQQNFSGRYDDMFDEKLKCEKCGFQVAGFCWKYIYKTKDIEREE